jgi:uncharacterized protein YjbI with pentapeptide repeats
MADAAHLDMLKRGVATWNQWRQVYPKASLNLREASLRGFDLSGASLRGADLCGADLCEANLRRADLHKARLHQADLRWANLHQATLREARLPEANLSGAHLREADLSGAHLRAANLSGANLGNANLSMADLRSACLREAHLSGALLLVARMREADLDEAELRETNLRGAHLRKASLRGANLYEANLRWTSLTMADLRAARLPHADLRWANLSMADLREAYLPEADLRGANLRGADLEAANLINARLVETNFEGANLEGCAIYGISAWETKLKGSKQANLRITPDNKPVITVDNLEVAQFIYLQLHNTHVRDAIETVGKRVVLVLGQFAATRQRVLAAIREALRQENYIPLAFDLDTPVPHQSEETLAMLARLARFVLVDMTDASSVLEAISQVRWDMPVPVQPLLHQEAAFTKPPLFSKLRLPPDVLLDTYWYKGPDDLRLSLPAECFAPAEAKAENLRDISTTRPARRSTLCRHTFC